MRSVAGREGEGCVQWGAGGREVYMYRLGGRARGKVLLFSVVFAPRGRERRHTGHGSPFLETTPNFSSHTHCGRGPYVPLWHRDCTRPAHTHPRCAIRAYWSASYPPSPPSTCAKIPQRPVAWAVFDQNHEIAPNSTRLAIAAAAALRALLGPRGAGRASRPSLARIHCSDRASGRAMHPTRGEKIVVDTLPI